MLRKCNSTYRVQVFGGAPAVYMHQHSVLRCPTLMPHNRHRRGRKCYCIFNCYNRRWFIHPEIQCKLELIHQLKTLTLLPLSLETVPLRVCVLEERLNLRFISYNFLHFFPSDFITLIYE